ASYFVETLSESSDSEMTLRLPSGSIRGRVRGPDGRAAAGVAVSLHPEQEGARGAGDCATAVTDAAGRYEFLYLTEGTYLITARGSGVEPFGETSTLACSRRSGVRVDAERETNGVDFDLAAGLELRGVIRDEAGNPVMATVFVRDASGMLVDSLS